MKEWSNETKVQVKKHKSLLSLEMGDGETNCFDLTGAWWNEFDVEYGDYRKGPIDLIFWKISLENIQTWDVSAYHCAYNQLTYDQFSITRYWCLRR